MPFKDIAPEISDAENIKGSVFDTWKDWGIRQTAGDPFGGFGTMLGGGSKITKLAPAVEQKLIEAAKTGNQGALESLYNQYKPMLMKLAPKGAPREDMAQEGYLALDKAIKAYDPTRGPFMNTLYDIGRRDLSIAGTRQMPGTAVDLPFKLLADKWKLNKATQQRLVRVQPRQFIAGEEGTTILPEIAGQKPTPESLSSRTGLSVDRIRQVQNLPQAQGISSQTEQSIRELIDNAIAAQSRGTQGRFSPETQAEQYAARAVTAKPTGARIYKKGRGPGTPLRKP